MHMRYALDTYQYIALGCAALVLFIIIQSLIIFLLGTYKRRADARRAVERLWNLPRGEPLEVQPAVSSGMLLPVGTEVQPALEREEPEPPEVQPAVSSGMLLPVGTEVQPILEHAEPPEVQPAVSAEVPVSVGTEVQPILEHGEPLESQPAVSSGMLLPVGAEVQPALEREEPEPPEVQPAVSSGMLLPVGTEVQAILEHGEPPEVQPAVSPEVPLPVGSKVWAVCNFGRVTEGAPGIITGAVDVRFFWQSPTYLCTFANNMKVHARPKDIERYNHGHSLEELEQPDFDSILSRRMTLRAQQLLSWQRPAHLPSAGSTECRTKLQN